MIDLAFLRYKGHVNGLMSLELFSILSHIGNIHTCQLKNKIKYKVISRHYEPGPGWQEDKDRNVEHILQVDERQNDRGKKSKGKDLKEMNELKLITNGLTRIKTETQTHENIQTDSDSMQTHWQTARKKMIKRKDCEKTRQTDGGKQKQTERQTDKQLKVVAKL